MIYLHKAILLSPKGSYIDHINNNTLDNRQCNLRICSNRENLLNRSAPKNNTSGYKGVQYLPRLKNGKNPYSASISTNGKSNHLGYYSTAEAAATAYNESAIKLFGEFAWLNKIKW